MQETDGIERSPDVFSSLIEQAIEVSAQWHDRTYRKGRWRDAPFTVPSDNVLSIPVMAHVTAVATTVLRAGWDDTTVAAAFLHDVLEDGNHWGDHMSFENLEALMGTSVAQLVSYVSERKFDDVGRRLPWKARKEGYVTSLQNAPQEAVAISLADKLHNLWSINESLARGVDVFSDGVNRRGLGAGPQEQLWFFSEVVSASSRFDDCRLDLLRDRLAEEIDRFKKLTST